MRQKTVSSSTPLVKKLDARSSRRSFAFLYITNECNLTCAHCSFQSAPDKKYSHMDTGLLLRLMDELQGVHDITLTGGEPLLHPGFAEVLSCAARNASLVYLMTNGINVVGSERLRKLARIKDGAALKTALKEALDRFPDNLHLFFPMDTFHLTAFKPFRFLLRGLADLAQEWNTVPERPFIGFLSNEVSRQKSEHLIEEFKVAPYSHIGTAMFSPWRNVRDITKWYAAYSLNQIPFPGGLYINCKGVYLNEASLLLDLRQGIETPLKIGTLNPTLTNKHQISELYTQYQHKVKI